MLSQLEGKMVFLSGPLPESSEDVASLYDKVADWCRDNGARYVYNPVKTMGYYDTIEQTTLYRISRLISPPVFKEKVLVNIPPWWKSSCSRLENQIAVAIGMKRYEAVTHGDQYTLCCL